MTDKAIRHLTTAAVLLVAAIAAVISFIHIRHLALSHGQDSLSAALLPLSIDGLVAAMSGVMLRAARLENVSTPWLARPMLFLGVGATLAANLAYGAAYGLVGALVSGWPAVAFVGCVEVSVAMVRRTRPVTDKQADIRVDTFMPTESKNPRSEPQKTGQSIGQLNGHATLTVAQRARLEGVSERTMYRRLAMANGNGKAH